MRYRNIIKNIFFHFKHFLVELIVSSTEKMGPTNSCHFPFFMHGKPHLLCQVNTLLKYDEQKHFQIKSLSRLYLHNI